MSFDPNPMGPITHLQQIEREVRKYQTHQRTSEKPQREVNDQRVVFSSWLARIAGLFAVPRTSN
jgi:hypothetical protein